MTTTVRYRVRAVVVGANRGSGRGSGRPRHIFSNNEFDTMTEAIGELNRIRATSHNVIRLEVIKTTEEITTFPVINVEPVA